MSEKPANPYEKVISDTLEKMRQSDEPDEWQIAVRNVKARRQQVKELVTEHLNKYEKARKRERVGRKKIRLTKSQITILAAARLTPTQEKYLRLRLEYGLGPTAIARKFGVHPSTVQESLKAAQTKIDNVKPRRPQWWS